MMMKSTRSLRFTLFALMGGMFAAAVLFSAPARAQTTANPITETNIFGSGTGLQTDEDADFGTVDGSVNGTEATVNASLTAFAMNKVVIQGDAGTVTVSYTIRNDIDPDDVSTQTITFTITTATGAVTVSGTDSSGGTVFGATATLNADASTATATSSGGSFTLTATGDPADRAVRTCVSFTGGLRVCADVYSVSNPAVNPDAPVIPDPANDPNAQPNGPAGIPNGNGGVGTPTGANYSEAIQRMADQMAHIMTYQLPIIGEMLDAKHQLETQRIFGAVAAQAFREYQPSEQVCAFGTLARSMAPSEFRVNDNISVINTILQKRESLNANQASSWGPSSDLNARLDKYKAVYCDPNDNAGQNGMANLCQVVGFNVRKNSDIDWRRTIEGPLTMDVDFTDATITPDEEDIISLAKNLYASDVISPIPETSIAPYGTYNELQDSRMLTAMRSVARYSFASIVASKARGSGLNAEQLRQVLENLGVPEADVVTLVGQNPSYFTQMEFMTQKMFQDPIFYTNLYSSPANVERMKVVMQAIRLIADRDRFEQSLRKEMLISLILEMRIRQAQDMVANATADAKAVPRR